MSSGEFSYESDLPKHFVRLDGWLPFCKRRREKINAGRRPSQHRRIKYFTFCAVGAVDVLLLDVEKVLPYRKGAKFNTVYFFNEDTEAVLETQRRIPGARGFAGEFVTTVLMDDPEEDIAELGDSLSAISEEEDRREVRSKQVGLDVRRRYIKSFPFDVINLDLQGFLFRPNDTLPGRLINAMREVFRWQKRDLIDDGKTTGIPIDGFTLMFTTKMGPDNIPADYEQMLIDSLQSNIDSNPSLLEKMKIKTGYDSVSQLMRDDFDSFFRLSLPKQIASVLMEADWYIDPAPGVKIYQFERDHSDGKYSILHLVMDVKRQNPSVKFRAPGTTAATARDAYKEVVDSIFQDPHVAVEVENLDAAALNASLEKIKSRRLKYCPDC